MAAVLAGLGAIQQDDIDAVMIYALTSPPVVAGTLIALAIRRPYWIYDHRSYYAELLKHGKGPSLFHSFAIPRARAIMAMSSRHKADISAVFPTTSPFVLPILPMPQPTAIAATTHAAVPRSSGQFLIGAWTNWRQIKRLDFLVEAFHAFARDRPEARLIVAGPLPDCDANRSAKQFLQEKMFNDRVDFVGPLSRSDITKLVNGLDLAAISSQYESLGLPALEALSAGTPVVTTDCGGPPEFIEVGFDGLVVPVDDAGAMAQAFVSIFENRAEFNREQIAARAVAQFSLSEQADTLAAVYRSGHDNGREGRESFA
jgi:glycosyltransferase involved in cell wall biosynthesis